MAERVTARRRVLDFGSSGQGHRDVTAVMVDGVELVNAVELADLDLAHADRVQVHVCEECGYVHCASGNWVTMRRMGEGLALIPAFGAMLRGAWDSSEYTPPAFAWVPGSPLFVGSALRDLQALMPGLPALTAVPPMSTKDVARIMQWEAPGRALGVFPSQPKLSRDLLIAVDDGDLRARMVALDDWLEDAMERPEQVTAKPGREVTFYLDLPGTPGWSALASVEGELAPALARGLAIVRERPPA